MSRSGAKRAPAKESDSVPVSFNREAQHSYDVEERYEAGMALTGTEVKSLRGGRVSLREGYVRVANGEAWLEGVHIPQYEHGTYINHEPTRRRKLLLHKAQIRELGQKSQAQGYTIVPLRLYFKGGRAKLEVALARGRRHYDKRQAIAERDSKREIARAVRDRS